MNNNVTVIVRSTNERTELLCTDLLMQQVPKSNIHVVHEIPFSKAVQRTFELGMEAKKEWTLAIDADILVTSDCVSNIIRLGESLEDYFFEVQGRILDKLYGVPRGGGPHLYRTKYLAKALKHIPKEGTSLRPESDVYDAMAHEGFHYYFGKDVFGLHDYEQFYKDLYRKGFMHSKKHGKYRAHFIEYWEEQAKVDDDFKVALWGLQQAELFKDTVYVNRSFFPDSLLEELKAMGLTEKCEAIQVKPNVDQEIEMYNKLSGLKNFEQNFFFYVKRSDLQEAL